jgi:hypothetical protein
MQFCKAQLCAVKVKPTGKSIHKSRLIITDLANFREARFWTTSALPTIRNWSDGLRQRAEPGNKQSPHLRLAVDATTRRQQPFRNRGRSFRFGIYSAR